MRTAGTCTATALDCWQTNCPHRIGFSFAGPEVRSLTVLWWRRPGRSIIQPSWVADIAQAGTASVLTWALR